MLKRLELILHILYFTTHCAHFIEAKSVVKMLPRIFDGKEVKDAELPYQISLQIMQEDAVYIHYCGGSLISPEIILTAATCVYFQKLVSILKYLYPVEWIYAYGGSVAMDDSGIRRKVREIIPHEGHSQTVKTLIDDIALLKLVKPFPPTNSLSPILIATKDFAKGTECVIAGFGLTTNINTTNTTYAETKLKKMEAVIDDLKFCADHYCPNFTINKKHVCTTNTSNPCRGDTGGGLVCRGRLMGIILHTEFCAENITRPYTNVVAYRDWIFKNDASQLATLFGLSIPIMIIFIVFMNI